MQKEQRRQAQYQTPVRSEAALAPPTHYDLEQQAHRYSSASFYSSPASPYMSHLSSPAREEPIRPMQHHESTEEMQLVPLRSDFSDTRSHMVSDTPNKFGTFGRKKKKKKMRKIGLRMMPDGVSSYGPVDKLSRMRSRQSQLSQIDEDEDTMSLRRQEYNVSLRSTVNLESVVNVQPAPPLLTALQEQHAQHMYASMNAPILAQLQREQALVKFTPNTRRYARHQQLALPAPIQEENESFERASMRSQSEFNTSRRKLWL